uniref:Uncharacterized protein n=1 Tax=Thermosporothrix sp. COM3 TaxID=2490863 RepID=A0A455SJU8_9CHLR|nr:hypothetical protein KTC_19800 [Thermosporothrix sp. COM3]
MGHPKLPKYKDKQKDRNILIYDIQALSKRGLKQGLVQPSQLGISIQTKQQNVKQARIIPAMDITWSKSSTQRKQSKLLSISRSMQAFDILG